MAEFASKGIAGAGLGLGIAGTALGLLNGNVLGELGRGARTTDAIATGVAGAMPYMAGAVANGVCNITDPQGKPITRYEFEQVLKYEKEIEGKNNQILDLTTDNKLKDANIYTDKKILETYENLAGRILNIQNDIAETKQNQAVVNSTLNSSVNVLANQVADVNNTLRNITQVKIPNSAVCPGFGDIEVVNTSRCCGGRSCNP